MFRKIRHTFRPWLLLVAVWAAQGQGIIDPAVLGKSIKLFTPQPDDRPLACTVTPLKATLNFSFHLQSGYVVSIPMKQYFGPGHKWLIAFRITPMVPGAKPVYFAGRTSLPDIPRTNVDIDLGSGFLLGLGRYHVEWMMYDDEGRVCRKDWRVEAKLQHSERLAKVATPPHVVEAFSLQGDPKLAATRDDRAPFRVTILMNATPLFPWRTHLRASDQVLLIGSLSALMERLPAKSVRLVVFNLDQQKELYRRDGFTSGSIDDVAQSLAGLQLNLVDYQILQKPKGYLDVLADLVNKELQSTTPSDVVIFLGPSTRFLDKSPAGIRPVSSGTASPLFFNFQYKPGLRRPGATVPDNVFQTAGPGVPDIVSQTSSALKGRTYTIFTPADFAKAIDELERHVTMR